MKVTLLVNPKASSVTVKKVARAVDVLGRGHDLTVVQTAQRDHATDLAREAAAEGAEVVFVLGGDGTLNEAANGLVGSQTAIAALPGGSTNVFARTLGTKRKLKKALPQMHAALSHPPAAMGVGQVNGRYFLFHLGMGFDAEVVAKVEQKPDLKRKIGQAVFVYAAFATFARFDRKHPAMAVEVDGETVVNDGYFGICLNTNPYTYLGLRPLHVAPRDAGPDRPLVLVTLRTLKLLRFLPLLGSTLARGRKLQKSKLVDYRPGLESVVVAAADGAGGFSYQCDGDYLGRTDRLQISFERDRLLVVYP